MVAWVGLTIFHVGVVAWRFRAAVPSTIYKPSSMLMAETDTDTVMVMDTVMDTRTDMGEDTPGNHRGIGSLLNTSKGPLLKVPDLKSLLCCFSS